MKADTSEKLRLLPGVDWALSALEDFIHKEAVPRSLATQCVRRAVESTRAELLAGGQAPDDVKEAVLVAAQSLMQKAMGPNLRRVINGTGVVVHTNLGRSVLAPQALEAVNMAASGYSNLEFDLATGRRGSRYSLVEDLLKELTGAQAALVVNNNAGAVFLSLMTLAQGRKVIVSRGELVEIGGSFRIPDVMARSGAILTEVGTTNRTHPADYEKAIDENTAMLMKAHTSNFAVVGFTASVSLAELCNLAKNRGLLVMEDLGSGSLMDLSCFGLAKEPTVGDSVAAGADIVTFSGDKLLGGPQAGIIVGRADCLDAIKKNPIARALRIDKLTLAALEATLRLYRDPEKAASQIPTLAMISAPEKALAAKARSLEAKIRKKAVPGLKTGRLSTGSRVGGGALPLESLKSFGVTLAHQSLSASGMEKVLRAASPPVIGRIEQDTFILDVRTIDKNEITLLADTIAGALNNELAGRKERLS